MFQFILDLMNKLLQTEQTVYKRIAIFTKLKEMSRSKKIFLKKWNNNLGVIFNTKAKAT